MRAPAVPRVDVGRIDACSHALLLWSPLLLGCAGVAVDRIAVVIQAALRTPLRSTTQAIIYALSTNMSVATPPPPLQLPLPRLSPRRLHPCSDVRLAASTS